MVGPGRNMGFFGGVLGLSRPFPGIGAAALLRILQECGIAGAFLLFMLVQLPKPQNLGNSPEFQLQLLERQPITVGCAWGLVDPGTLQTQLKHISPSLLVTWDQCSVFRLCHCSIWTTSGGGCRVKTHGFEKNHW